MNINNLFGENVDTIEAFAEKLNAKFAEYSGMKEALTKQGETITKMKMFASATQSNAPAIDLIKQALEANKVNALKQGEKLTFEVKAITGSVMTAGANQIALPYREGEIDKPIRNIPFLQDLIPSGQTTSKTIDWLEMDVKTDASATRDENDEIGEGALEYIEKSVTLKNVGELIKVTEEALSDYNFLASEINTELRDDINLLLSNELLTGTGLTTHIEGLTVKASAFAAGDFADTVVSPNQLDVLRVAVSQIVTAGKGRFTPNYAIVNPTDLTKMNLVKSTTGEYILPAWVTDSGLRIAGVQIIPNTAMTAGDYLVGDFSKAKVFYKDGLQIQLGWEGTDFKYNRVTVRGTLRAALRVKSNDEAAFVFGDFATDIIALTSGA